MADAATPKAANGSTTAAPDTVEVSDAQAAKADDSSKLKTFLNILRKFIGVPDLAAIRFSLPAHLLEPTPNLEYWTYLDRPETFVAIGDSEDPVGRMLSVVRFWNTKDLKYVTGKPCKPYNSTLGEFFRCNFDIEDTLAPPRPPSNSTPASSSASVASTKSSSATATTTGTSSTSTPGASTSTPNPAQPTSRPTSAAKAGSSAAGGRKVRVSFLTEQTSHHPPVSAWYAECPEKGVVARGYDHIAAKFTGTSVRVAAGAHNHGIYIGLKNWGEEYRLTHPVAHVGGLLRGSLNVTVSETCCFTCSQTRLKVIMQYMDDGWLSKTQHRVEGIAFRYDPDNDSQDQKIKHVPEKDIVARIQGNWVSKMYYTLGNAPFSKVEEKHLLTDLTSLRPIPKSCPPLSSQLPNESRRFWNRVTESLMAKQFSQATAHKHDIEEKQRAKAAQRKARGVDWAPRFFRDAFHEVGRPELTPDGRRVVDDAQRGVWDGVGVAGEHGAF